MSSLLAALSQLHAALRNTWQTTSDPDRHTHPSLEELEARSLMSASSSEPIFATFNRWDSGSTSELGLSRIDPDTGVETVLFSKPGSVYERAGPVATMSDGDVVFALHDDFGNTTVRRFDSATGRTSTLFSSSTSLSGLAVGPKDEVIGSWSRWGAWEMGISQFDAQTGRETVLYRKPEGIYEGSGPVAVASDGDVLFTLYKDWGTTSQVLRYDTATRSTSEVLTLGGTINDLKIKPDGKLVVGSTQGDFLFAINSLKVSEFDPNKGRETVLFNKPLGIYEHAAGPVSVAVASDGDVLFVLSTSNPANFTTRSVQDLRAFQNRLDRYRQSLAW